MTKWTHAIRCTTEGHVHILSRHRSLQAALNFWKKEKLDECDWEYEIIELEITK